MEVVKRRIYGICTFNFLIFKEVVEMGERETEIVVLKDMNILRNKYQSS